MGGSKTAPYREKVALNEGTIGVARTFPIINGPLSDFPRDQLFFGFQPDGFGGIFGSAGVDPEQEGAQGDFFMSRRLGMDGIVVVMVFHDKSGRNQ